MRSLRYSLALLVTAAVLAVAAVPGGASTGARVAKCTPATNIEAIVDDSGSMATSDPNRLRVQGLDLLINTLKPATMLGAIEFGGSYSSSTPSADTVFKPETVGPNAASMKALLGQMINADNGSTDYNAAFALSDADNPAAGARIFLTDGGHNVGAYNNGHLVHRVPTYVIGFSPGIATASDQARLRQIASDTGGRYYPLSDSSQLQAVINSIGARLTCQAAPRRFTDLLRQGQRKTHALAIGAHVKSVQLALTWASPLDRFTAYNLKLIRHGKVLARAARVRRLHVTRTGSATFMLLRVSGLQRGTLRFTVKATKVGSPEPKVTLTTQVTQIRRK